MEKAREEAEEAFIARLEKDEYLFIPRYCDYCGNRQFIPVFPQEEVQKDHEEHWMCKECNYTNEDMFDIPAVEFIGKEEPEQWIDRDISLDLESPTFIDRDISIDIQPEQPIPLRHPLGGGRAIPNDRNQPIDWNQPIDITPVADWTYRPTTTNTSASTHMGGFQVHYPNGRIPSSSDELWMPARADVTVGQAVQLVTTSEGTGVIPYDPKDKVYGPRVGQAVTLSKDGEYVLVNIGKTGIETIEETREIGFDPEPLTDGTEIPLAKEKYDKTTVNIIKTSEDGIMIEETWRDGIVEKTALHHVPSARKKKIESYNVSMTEVRYGLTTRYQVNSLVEYTNGEVEEKTHGEFPKVEEAKDFMRSIQMRYEKEMRKQK